MKMTIEKRKLYETCTYLIYLTLRDDEVDISSTQIPTVMVESEESSNEISLFENNSIMSMSSISSRTS